MDQDALHDRVETLPPKIEDPEDHQLEWTGCVLYGGNPYEDDVEKV